MDEDALTMLYILPMETGRRLGLLLVVALHSLAAPGCQKVEARSLAKQGNELYRAGKFDQALGKFEAAVRLDPQHPLLQLHLGYAAMSLAAQTEGPTSAGFSDRASKAFARYMKLAPEDERGPKFYLQVLLDAGQLKQALRFLEQQHRQNPGDLRVVSSLGMVASKAGDFAGALKWYEKRAALLPSEPTARYLVGTLCWEHLYKNTGVVGAERVKIADRGIAALERALELQPGYAEAMTYINLLYRERAKGHSDDAARERDMEQARRYYQRALELLKQPKKPERQPKGRK
jgi:tetratricopeptide (TPR) repeat protein